MEGSTLEEWYKLECEVKGQGIKPSGEIFLKIDYFPSRKGTLLVTLHEGSSLPNRELFGKQVIIQIITILYYYYKLLLLSLYYYYYYYSRIHIVNCN